jgi:hypothetical protein
MKNILNIIISLVLIGFLSGCVTINPYEKFYHSYYQGDDIFTDLSFVQTNSVEIHSVNKDEMESAVIGLIKANFAMLGASSFNGALYDEKYLIETARKKGANVVIYTAAYTDTESGSIPLTLPDIQNTTFNYSGSVSSYDGGYGSYSGYGNATTYGTSTTYIPYNSRRYDQNALYFKKLSKLPPLGIFFNSLSKEETLKYQRNTGVVVYVVIDDTPAFYENILIGDVIISVNGESVINKISMSKLLDKYSPTGTLRLKILRGTMTIEKNIILFGKDKG